MRKATKTQQTNQQATKRTNNQMKRKLKLNKTTT